MFNILFFLFIFSFYLIFAGMVMIGTVKIVDLILKIKKSKNETDN
jgi:hypothetical protein